MHGPGCVVPCPRVMGPIVCWGLYCVTQGQQGECQPALLANCHMGCSGVLGMLPDGLGMLGVQVGVPQYMVALSRILAPLRAPAWGEMMLWATQIEEHP